jgi:hypothetical protein
MNRHVEPLISRNYWTFCRELPSCGRPVFHVVRARDLSFFDLVDVDRHRSKALAGRLNIKKWFDWCASRLATNNDVSPKTQSCLIDQVRSGTVSPRALKRAMTSSRPTHSVSVEQETKSTAVVCVKRAAMSFFAGWFSASYIGDTMARASSTVMVGFLL